jgi:response regulator RpfG family c-di-GMP phosphodiesterase
MAKRVLDVGNCEPDHAAIRNYLTRNFDVDIVQVDDAAGATAQLHANSFDLVLVNRKLDIDYSDGIDVIRDLKSNPKTAHVPMMLITNFPDHQEAALEAGAIRGFGKLEFGMPETRDRLAAILE